MTRTLNCGHTLPFFSSCVDWPEEHLDVLDHLITKGEVISRRTFIKAVGLKALREKEKELGYETHPGKGLTMAADWHVEYFRLPNAELVFFKWSGIEHVYASKKEIERLRVRLILQDVTEDIVEAAVREENVREKGVEGHFIFSSWDINTGWCDAWAEKAVEELGSGRAWWVEKFEEDDRGGHCVLVYRGRYYDSQHLDGVDEIEELDFANRVSRDEFLRGHLWEHRFSRTVTPR